MGLLFCEKINIKLGGKQGVQKGEPQSDIRPHRPYAKDVAKKVKDTEEMNQRRKNMREKTTPQITGLTLKSQERKSAKGARIPPKKKSKSEARKLRTNKRADGEEKGSMVTKSSEKRDGSGDMRERNSRGGARRSDPSVDQTFDSKS